MDRERHCERGHGSDKSFNAPSSREIDGDEPKFSVSQVHSSDHDDFRSDGLAVTSDQSGRESAIDERILAETAEAPVHEALVERLPTHAHMALISDLVSDEEGSSSNVPLWDMGVDNLKLTRKSTTSTDNIPEDFQSPRSSCLAEDDQPAVSVEELKDIMIGRGWCSHQIEYLTKIYQLPVLYRLARLDRKAQRPEDHRCCLKEKACIAYNSPQTETYETKHAASCPRTNCTMIKVPYQDLVRIIRSGGVPLVSIHEHSDAGFVISVHRRKFRGDYITISHVWADGLGNPRENALPRCQIKLLQSLFDHQRDAGWSGGWVKRLDSMLFGGRNLRMLWMDTLCIPPNDTSLRAQCIDAMASIYAGSSRTFVIDKELMAIPMNRNFDELHILEQIICSVWMSRSWTLQEAILPEGCLFQLDGAVFQPSPDRLDYITSEDAICRTLFNDILPADARDRTRAESFLSIWNNLAGRSTTQAADLYIVLASCLDFKLRQFRKFETFGEKMQCMVFSFQELPFSLFFNAGPRLRSASNHYNRWVPTQISRHLLTVGTSTFVFPGPNVSQYSDHGTRLEVKLGSDLSIYVIDEVISTPSAFNIHTSDGHYVIQPLMDAEDTFQTTVYSATLLFVAKNSLGASSMRSGACFYVFTSQTSEDLHCEESMVEMAYFCPVLFKVLDTPSYQRDHDARKFFAAREAPCTWKFWVRFGMYELLPIPMLEQPQLSSPLNSFGQIADPLPGFRPLKRQNRKKQFASFGMKICVVILLLNEILLVSMTRPVFNSLGFYYTERYTENDTENDTEHDTSGVFEEIHTGAGDLVLILSNMCIGMLVLSLPWFVGTFIMVRLRDYIILYQSYDDNSVVDKVARLVTAVGRAVFDGLRGICSLLFYALGLFKPDEVVSNESIEVG